MRWVLWQKAESEERYTRRTGRYASKTAAEDAMKTLAKPEFRLLALPEDAEPQANKAKARSTPTAGPSAKVR